MTEIWTLEQYRAYLAGQTTITPRFLALDAMAPEEELQARLYALCQTTGHLYYHTRKSQGSTAGFPDVVMVHPGGGPLYLWELKRAGKNPQPAQRRWLEALARASHIETGVWRPCDWEHLYTLLTSKEMRP